MTTLLHLAEQKYQRQRAENAANPNVQIREPWRLLLDAMADALTGEARERVAERLRGEGAPRCKSCGRSRHENIHALCGESWLPIADEPEPAPDPDQCGCEETERLREQIANLERKLRGADANTEFWLTAANKNQDMLDAVRKALVTK